LGYRDGELKRRARTITGYEATTRLRGSVVEKALGTAALSSAAALLIVRNFLRRRRRSGIDPG
jgi:hypothetical protein